jgi:hypothetical protein
MTTTFLTRKLVVPVPTLAAIALHVNRRIERRMTLLSLLRSRATGTVALAVRRIKAGLSS